MDNSGMLEALLDKYDSMDRQVASIRQIHELLLSSPQNFLEQWRTVLARRPASKAVEAVLGLVGMEALVDIVLETYLRSKDEALCLVKKLLQCQPRLDAMLLQQVQNNHGVGWSDDAVLVVLDILDAISEGERLVLNVSKFLKHPNPKLRSKAVLYIARRRPRVHWVTELSKEPDPRVRANIIESLYEVQEPFVATLFRKHVSDSNNRVAGNAILGLYHLGDANAVHLIAEMARDTRAEFRRTGAWVIGKTGDSRFSPLLAEHLSDPDPLLRGGSLRSLAQIKAALTQARNHTPLQVSIVSNGSDENECYLTALVSDEAGQAVRGIAPTRFVLRAGDTFLMRYAVEEYSCDTPIHLAFVLCMPPKSGEELVAGFDQAIQICAQRIRAKDAITSSKISSQQIFASSERGTSSFEARAQSVLPQINFNVANLHIVFVTAIAENELIEELLQVPAPRQTKVHLVTLSDESRHAPAVKRIEAKSGFVQHCQHPATLPQILRTFYLGIQHHYRVTWRGDGNAALSVDSRPHKVFRPLTL